MRLSLRRTRKTSASTGGELFVDGAFECYTLEDAIRDHKIPGRTAIPAGTYSVSLTHSSKFGRILPLLENVAGFQGVRIHPGNKPEDTEGCILVGRIYGQDSLTESKLAFDVLLSKLSLAQSQGKEISIQIS
jgi:hypothetical protein